jgi:hypothetical protein
LLDTDTEALPSVFLANGINIEHIVSGGGGNHHVSTIIIFMQQDPSSPNPSFNEVWSCA